MSHFGHLKTLFRDFLIFVNCLGLGWSRALWGALTDLTLQSERYHLENTAPARDGLTCLSMELLTALSPLPNNQACSIALSCIH